MEGGNKVSLNLEAGLDIKSSDMLVPSASPTFQHNWQKFQGKYLPNSLRFEKNGWAAGWNVYNFEYNTYRKEQNGYYIGLGSFNQYTKTLSIYASEKAYSSLYTVYVVPETRAVVGDLVIDGNEISGKVGDRDFSLTWDPVGHTLTSDDPDINVTYSVGVDYSVSFVVSEVNGPNSFTLDFGLLLPGSLTGDSISPASYSGYLDSIHTWGGYSYDTRTDEVVTPEGVIVTPVVDSNTLSFDYSYIVTDESITVTYNLSEFYLRFKDIICQDLTNKQNMLLGGSDSLPFNYYKASVSSTVLKAKDANGVVLDWQLPLWLTLSLGVIRPASTAKWCDNTLNYEVAVTEGSGINMQGTVNNVFIGENDFTVVDEYRPSGPKYITGLKYRFNQIFLDNTLALSADWDPRKYILNTEVWYLDSRQYANIRNKDVVSMEMYLGGVYTWGQFVYKPADTFEYNDPYNLSDPASCVYTMQDISDILTFKLKGTSDSVFLGDDEDFVRANMPAIGMSLIAEFSGSVTEYNDSQADSTYADLYDVDGKYIGDTYETIGVDPVDFWPFEKVPKFNWDGHQGVYWTDGVNYIDDITAFKSRVLGQKDVTLDTYSQVLLTNDTYNRTRVVKCYRPGYDFDYIRQSDYVSMTDYATAKAVWNAVWEAYYPDIMSPQDSFSDTLSNDDATYLNFNDIEVLRNVDPGVKYVTPGVYVFNNMAVPFGNNAGLVVSDMDEYKFTVNIWHHAISVEDRYTIRTAHEEGTLRYGKYIVNIPYYFGSATSISLVSGNKSNGSFRELKSVASLTTSALTASINCELIQRWADSEGNRYTKDRWGHLIDKDGKCYDTEGVAYDDYTDIYKVWDWIPLGSIDDACWLKTLQVSYRNGSYSVNIPVLNSGVEAVRNYYITGDINSGIKFAWPVWGHSKTRITYPEIKNAQGLATGDAFTFTTVPTSQLSDTRVIYFDRDDTVKSQLLFNVTMNSQARDNMSVTLSPVDGAVCYYAEKQYNAVTRQETISSYYIPGIAYGSLTSKEGNLTTMSDYPVVELAWTPVAYRFPISVLEEFRPVNSSNAQHVFYDSTKSLLSNVTYELQDIDYNALTQDIVLKFPAGDYVLHYDGANETTAGASGQVLFDDGKSVVTVAGCLGEGAGVTVALDIGLSYPNNTAKFIQLSDYTLVSSDSNNCVITDGTHQIGYSINSQAVTDVVGGADVDVTVLTDMQCVHIDSTPKTQCIAYLQAAYDGEIADSTVTFSWNGQEFNWDLTEEVDTGIRVVSTDIRTPEKTKVIGKLMPEGQYQLLRQQWNTTVEVENYWWLDPTHILELNRYSFIVKRNTKELDDWNGERFEKVIEVNRDQVLPADVTRYFVPNVYKSDHEAMFITLRLDAGDILLTFYDPRRVFEVKGSQRIRAVCRNIGQKLNSTAITDDDVALFNSYNPLTAELVLSKAEWTGSVVGNWLVIGCHLSNNFDQWAVVINLSDMSLHTVIQGYGYVGLHGELTGGQIPDAYFDAMSGFNSVVQPLSVLGSDSIKLNDLDSAVDLSNNVAAINNVQARVVGTSEQQWYIGKKVYGVVSHLTFTDGKFEKQLLPITNNYSAVYDSPSWESAVLGDAIVSVQPIANILSMDGAANTVWQMLVGFLGYPLLYSIAPRYAQLVYLQQTMGQYAYVHYNSSKSLPENEAKSSTADSGMNEEKWYKNSKQTDPVLSSDFVFDKQKVTQAGSVQLDYYANFIGVLIASFADSLDFISKSISINEEVNTSTVKDSGRKFVDNAALNTADLLSTAIMTQAKNDIGCTSSVTGIKSLDMFYSTSDQQHVYAGPGFVEHQFVADCVAQSVTDTQTDGRVQQLYFAIRGLTTLQIKMEIKAELLLADATDKAAEALENQTVCGTSLASVAAGIFAAAAAIRAAVSAQEVALEEIDKILDIICAKGLTVNTDAIVSRHNLSTEGKHRYGEKNEVFMWPCFGVQPGQIKYTDEWVEAGIRNTPWQLCLNPVKSFMSANFAFNTISIWHKPNSSSNMMGTMQEAKAYVGNGGSWNYAKDEQRTKAGDTYRAYYMKGKTPFYQASAFGKAVERVLPDDMACIEGVNRLLPDAPFKNENIAVSDPAFAPSMQQDYIIDKAWDLSQYCTYGMQQWVTVKDTKVIDCPPSNMIVSDTFCGVACPYTAVEVKRGIEKAYMRPWAVTPNVLAWNCTGYNSVMQDRLYHSFDGISYRLVNLVGSPGMGKNRQSFWYSFQVNDRFKRSNKVPANELQGNFMSEPVQAVNTIDKMYTLMTVAANEKGLEAGTIGEDKDLIRWAIPVFTEHVSTLPAAVKTMTAMPLGVVEGVTSLCIELANNQSAYKAPLSVDFTIGKSVYRATEEYICSVQTQDGVDVVTDLVPILGLKYIGSTPTEAYFYSQANRCYYTFSGSTLTKIDMMERFRDIQKGYWDFMNQEVIMPCLMTYKRLNREVEDTDTETDNIIIPVLSKGHVSGELPPPLVTIFNDRSWYKCVSLPSGFAYQGPNRVIINRGVFVEYMLDSVRQNLGKWSRMNREKYVTHRVYPDTYDNILKDVTGVDGWTYNPFVIVTSALGVNEDSDCVFEWVITFCWPIEMDLIYGTDNYACVNIMAETMTPGGKKVTRPTHVFLTKELFTRDGNYGYYSFTYQSKNGAGNRERLHIWSDQYIAISSIDHESKVVTTKRTSQLTQQVDVRQLKEL